MNANVILAIECGTKHSLDLAHFGNVPLRDQRTQEESQRIAFALA